jgi:hypothetical protein
VFVLRLLDDYVEPIATPAAPAQAEQEYLNDIIGAIVRAWGEPVLAKICGSAGT